MSVHGCLTIPCPVCHPQSVAIPPPAAVPAADAELRAAVEGLAEGYAECWVTHSRSSEFHCTSFIDGEFGNGQWTEQMCCLPCRLRSLLAGRGDVG